MLQKRQARDVVHGLWETLCVSTPESGRDALDYGRHLLFVCITSTQHSLHSLLFHVVEANRHA